MAKLAMMDGPHRRLTLRILPGLAEATVVKEEAAAGMDGEVASCLVTSMTRGSMGGEEEMVQ